MSTRPPVSTGSSIAGRGGVPDGVMNVALPSERLAWATYSASGDRASGINRDAVVAVTRGEEGLFAVADGMGHLKGSENASRIAADRLTALFSRGLGEPRTFLERLSETTRAICAGIREKIELEGGDRSMGTTLTGCAVFGGKYTVFHIGDSRLYHYSVGRMIRRTEDHTRQAEAERTGIRVPDGLPPHQLTRALMYADEKTTAVAFYPSDGGTFPLLPGDILVACTDGVHKHLTDSDFSTALEGVTDAESLGKALQHLALRALANGSTDDRSLTGVYVAESGVGGRVSSVDVLASRRLPAAMLWMVAAIVVLGIGGLTFLLTPRPTVTPAPTPTVEASPTAPAENPDPGQPSPSASPSPEATPDVTQGEETPPVITPPVTGNAPTPLPTRGSEKTAADNPKRAEKPQSSGSGSRIRLSNSDKEKIRRLGNKIKSRIPRDIEITIPGPVRIHETKATPKPRSSPKGSGDDDPRRPKNQGTSRPEPARPEKPDDDPRRPKRK